MHYCPSCGYNFERDPIIESGLWRLDPGSREAFHNGDPFPVSGSVFEMLYATAAAKGQVVSRDALLGRMGSDAEGNVLDVWKARLKEACSARMIALPVETVRGRGFRWVWTKRHD